MIEHAPIFIILTPAAGALILELISKFDTSERVSDLITLSALAIPVVLLFSFAPALLEDPIVYELGGWEKPYGITLVLDSLSATMATIVGIVTLSSFVYSLESKEMLPRGERYYFLFLFMTTGLYGVFLTGDLINRYVFFELTVLTTYVLLTYTGTKESLKASYYYLIIGGVASFMFLIGIALLYFNTGYLDIEAMGKVVPGLDKNTKILIFSFFAVAIGVKSGLIPFHSWLPDAHVSAPDTITAVLGGVTVKVGAYILLRILPIGFSIQAILNVLIVIGLATGILASLVTFFYWDLKRILTWHTIAQIGLIVSAIGLWSSFSVASALYHTVNHAVFKTLLFLSAGALSFMYGTRDIRELPLQRGNLIIVGTFLIGLLALIGIPPLNGFYSKSFIVTSALSRPLVLIPILLIHIITVSSAFRIIYYTSKHEEKAKAPVSMMKILVILAGLCVFIGTTTTLWME
ncbi:MAG: hypothetical protein KGY76_07865, partial [Candidatus Thermoplasmatota archaeon]|nr:hypothetical protein [Candidatus Thermoplasmatota archaeon]